MIPFHSPFSFFLPKISSFTTSISKVKFNRSARSSKISTQKPVNRLVEFEAFEAFGTTSSRKGSNRRDSTPSYPTSRRVAPKRYTSRMSVREREISTYDHSGHFQRLVLDFLFPDFVIFGIVSSNFQSFRSIGGPFPILDRATVSSPSSELTHTLFTPVSARSTTSNETSVRRPFSSNLIFPVIPLASN